MIFKEEFWQQITNEIAKGELLNDNQNLFEDVEAKIKQIDSPHFTLNHYSTLDDFIELCFLE